MHSWQQLAYPWQRDRDFTYAGVSKFVYLIKNEPFKMLLLTNFWNSIQIRNRACVPCALIQFLFHLFVERFRYRFFRLSSGFAVEYIPSESHKLIDINWAIWTSVRHYLHVVVHICTRSERGCWTRNIKCKCVPLDTKIRPGFKSQ